MSTERYKHDSACNSRQLPSRELRDDLGDYHLFHATRADLLRDLGRSEPARAAGERALALTTNPAERSLLRQRLDWA